MENRTLPILALLLSTLGASAPAQTAVNGPMIIFIGVPGSGKSTMAARAAREYGLPIISAEQMAKDYPQLFEKNAFPGLTGMTMRSDPAMSQAFAATLKKTDISKGLILDGYPATKDHCDYLKSLVTGGQLPNPVVIDLEISDKEVIKRESKMPGYNAQDVQQRLMDFHREMDFVTTYFPNANLNQVDSKKKPDQVWAAVQVVLNNNVKK
jgi:adenylate kinase family enzyme